MKQWWAVKAMVELERGGRWGLCKGRSCMVSCIDIVLWHELWRSQSRYNSVALILQLEHKLELWYKSNHHTVQLNYWACIQEFGLMIDTTRYKSFPSFLNISCNIEKCWLYLQMLETSRLCSICKFMAGF